MPSRFILKIHTRQLFFNSALQCSLLFFFKIYFICYIFGLCWVFIAAWALVVATGGYSAVAVCGLLIAVASLALELSGFSSGSTQTLEHRLSSCGTWAKMSRGMWDIPILGIKPVSPASVGGFFTIEPPGMPHYGSF